MEDNFISNPRLFDEISKLDYSHKCKDGAYALANLFKFAAFTSKIEYFNLFRQRAKDYAIELGRHEAEVLPYIFAEIMKDGMIENFHRTFNKRMPKFIPDYVDDALRFYNKLDTSKVAISSRLNLLIEIRKFL